LVHTYLSNGLDTQNSRNKYLADEIAKVDKQIEEIKKLKEQTAALLARKQVVETLQSNRAEVVHLLDQLVRQLPDGIYLKAIKQIGNRVTINGYTQSQARVSTLMRNLESSPYLEKPGLIEIRAVQQGPTRTNEFTLNAIITRVASAPAAKPASKPAAPGGKS
jgi:type IV pilus assembly protein PilN